MKTSNRIWHDLMSSLIYPAILGTIIYSFINNLVSFIIHNDSVIFLQDLGIGRNTGFILFTIFSFLVIWHYCIDFLYTVFSEGTYTGFNFLCDVCINFFLALSFILISDSFTKTTANITYIKYSLATFWGSLIIIYSIFFIWDYKAYKVFRNTNVKKAAFYKSMMRPFELSAFFVYSILLGSCFITFGICNQLNILYLVISLIVFFTYTFWFWIKLKKLERITKK
jgi:hypothetical protein